ncbi:MAG: hypothetical protein ACRDRN_21680 [Sciscionella sp.]
MDRMDRRSFLGLTAAAAVPMTAGFAGHAQAAPARSSDLPDLGPSVLIFDPSQPDVQAKVDQVFAAQESNQFGTQRYALLFKPGAYSVNVNVGFYTSVAGLGSGPDDVTINGGVTVDAGWFNGNATQNFWRSVENLSIAPAGGFDRWAVAQAAPFRRIHVRGDLNLSPTGYGWASGGYIADSKIDGTVQPYSQQQWLTRDSQIGSWLNGVWNMVFSGVAGAPAQSFPDPPYTVLDNSPITREKPYLYLDTAGSYAVFVPALRTGTRGVSWAGGASPGNSVPLTQFYVARPGDTAAAINQALGQGKHLLLTPGVYQLDRPIEVTSADTVVLGLGYATLTPTAGTAAMTVADVDGVKVCGVLFDAGATTSPVLLRLGGEGANARHGANPTSVQDVFFRIGGAGAGSATTSLEVNSSDVLIDHIWAWRADHGSGVGWSTNPADTGVVVNGSGVLAYGLFVEHYQKYEVIWNGDGGRTIFFQNEMPYDPPNQAAWRTDAQGYASYKVADGVSSHEAWGVGSYCNFTADPSIVAAHAFEVPAVAGVSFHDLLTVSLGGKGKITHIINGKGGPAQGTDTVPAYLTSFVGSGAAGR